MPLISSILRVVCGLVLIILSISTYRRNAGHIAAGEPLQLFGTVTSLAGWQLTLALGVIGLIGLFLLILGVVGFLKRQP